MSRSAGSFITAGPENLRCCACPSLPRFTNASHLLTHLCSKYHLKVIFELELRAKGDQLAASRLDQYHQWYGTFGVDRALAHRQKLKEDKVMSAAREREEDELKAQMIKEEDRKQTRKAFALDPQLLTKTPILKTPARPSSMTLLTQIPSTIRSIEPRLLLKKPIINEQQPIFPKIEVDDSANLFAQGNFNDGFNDGFYIDDDFLGLIKGEPEVDMDTQSLCLPADATRMMRTFRFREGELSSGVPRTGASFFDGEEDLDPTEMKVKGKNWPGMKCFDWATPKLRAKRLAANAQRKVLDAINAAEAAAETAAAKSVAEQERAVYEEYVEDTEMDDGDVNFDDDDIDGSDATPSVEPQTPRNEASPISPSSTHHYAQQLQHNQFNLEDGYSTTSQYFNAYFMQSPYSNPPVGFAQETLGHTQWQQPYAQQQDQQDLTRQYSTQYATPNIANRRAVAAMSSHHLASEQPSKCQPFGFAWCEPENEKGIFGPSHGNLPAYQNVNRQNSLAEFFQFSAEVVAPLAPTKTNEQDDTKYVETLLELAIGAGAGDSEEAEVASTPAPTRSCKIKLSSSSRSRCSPTASSPSSETKPPTKLTKISSRKGSAKCTLKLNTRAKSPERHPGTPPITGPTTRSSIKRRRIDVTSPSSRTSTESSITSLEDDDDDYSE